MTRPPDAQTVAHAAELILQADALLIGAGAGMGVDSGLPDFRGRQGFWRAYPALARAQLDFHSVACPQAFQTQPRQAWGFYGHRLNLYRATRPHAGFDLLRAWGARMPMGVAVFTSNVDGQFQAAGFNPTLVHECHGSIDHWQCLHPCCQTIWPAPDGRLDVDEANCLLQGPLPACPRCGRVARPNVLMFGDGQWVASRADRQGDALQGFLARVRRPVVLEIGAGTAIASVRHFSARMLQQHDARLVRINPRESAVPTTLDVGLAGPALEALVAIGHAMEG